MSRLPVCSGADAVKAFRKLRYEVDHQTGSHKSAACAQLCKESRRRDMLFVGHCQMLFRGHAAKPRAATLPQFHG